MNERSMRRNQGAPFYAPPRRKTSAEIISEARAAIYGDNASPESSANGGSGALRPLRTRRPFTPRDPQRTLFGDRTRRKEPRPPSAFNLKYLSLSESSEDAAKLLLPSGDKVSSLDETNFHGVLLTEPQVAKKKSMLSSKIQSQDTSWAGFPKLPHLSGHSKPLHKRRNEQPADGSKSDSQLASAISITQALQGSDNTGSTNVQANKSNSADSANVKRRQFGGTKSLSDANPKKNHSMGDIGVKHLAVQIPNSSGLCNYESMTTLELAEALSQRIARSVDRTLMLLEALQLAVEKVSPATSLRDFVLRSLYIYVDSDDERLIVGISRIMLTMRVTGAHLAVACKLVFKVARNDKNDHFFRSTNLLELLVEGCGRACPLAEGECTVYGAGALRFLALEPRLRILALKAGALHLAALHLKILNNAKAENPRGVSEQSTHALYQLTGALRNLAGGNSGLSAFVASGALAELLTSLQLFLTDRDVLTNLVRCLSVLSADEACCAWLCAASNSASSLLTALATCAARAPLAVRLAYTLGNMAAAEEHARLSIYNEEGSIDVLLTILESYTQRTDKDTRDTDVDPDLHLVGSDLGGSDGSCEDVLIKTVRVVANVCLCEQAGRGLAASHAERTIEALLACIKLASPIKSHNKHLRMQSDLELDTEEERREELATASLATLNNITFYREPSIPSDPLDSLFDDLCRVTCKWLPIHKGYEEAACEAVRALGNLSRSPRAADIIVREGALDALTQILQHDDAAVRCAGAGVLVNICGAGGGDAATGATIDALSRAATRGDANTAALLARALWNAQAHAPLDSTHAYQAETALSLFIDDESVFAACEASNTSDRRSSEADLSKHQVRFDMANNNHSNMERNYLKQQRPGLLKAFSADQDLNVDNSGDENDRTACSGEDLGFEDGDVIADDFCNCAPCRRLAAWEELVGVAIPLLEKLRPARADASVGTD